MAVAIVIYVLWFLLLFATVYVAGHGIYQMREERNWHPALCVLLALGVLLVVAMSGYGAVEVVSALTTT